MSRAGCAILEGLGFRVTEDIQDDEGTAYAAWLRRKPTVHDTALTGGAGPRLHHVAFATHEQHNIIAICDKLGALGMSDHIERGPGRHGVSNAFYLYMRDPDGHRVEIYTQDYYTGDPDNPVVTWDVHDNQRRDWWGNPVVPSWYTEAAWYSISTAIRSPWSSARSRARWRSQSAPTDSRTPAGDDRPRASSSEPALMQFHHHGYVSGEPRVAAGGRRGHRPAVEELPDEVDVLIVGAGPAGMIAAAQLSQFPNVTTRIVERRAGRLAVGQADGIQARSVETFQAFGFAERIIAEAYRITQMAFWKPDPDDPTRIVRDGAGRMTTRPGSASSPT